ncbi:MAG: hypothetical protein A2289_13170 [Deltaproteobacteria bacterium RIFOXYA12_FULL_58_15]|nr:MAG: hypothetical protein A2289_13170 [Deltaproteobacteria bacterium RIFOXYA12_FULL_58_15]
MASHLNFWVRARLGLERLVGRIARSHHTQALALFLVLAWVIRFSGALNSLTRLSYVGDPNDDAGQFFFYFWHFKEAVLGRRDWFFSDHFFYPLGVELAQQDWAPMPSLLALPFQVFGPIAAHNLEVLLAYALCGYAAYLLALRVARHRAFALLAGALFTFSFYRFEASNGHTNQINQQFIPLYALALVSFVETRKMRHAYMGGLWFAAATLCSAYHAIMLVIFTPLVAALTLGQALAPGGARILVLRSQGALWARFVLGAGVVALLLLAPILAPNWEAIAAGAQALGPTLPVYAADLLGYVTSPHWYGAFRPMSDEGRYVFQGYGLLALLLFAVVTAHRRTGAGVWLLLAGAFFLLSLGGTLVIGGEARSPLPFSDLVAMLPLGQGFRVSARFATLVTLCGSIAVAVTLAHLDRQVLQHRSTAVRAAVVGALCLLPVSEAALWSRAVGTARTYPTAVEPIYHELAHEPGTTVLDFPLVWETHHKHLGPHWFPRKRYLEALVHGKRLLSGLGDAIPSASSEYFLRLPLLRDLHGIVDPIWGLAPSTHEQASYVLAFLDTRHIVFDSGPMPTPAEAPPVGLRRAWGRKALDLIETLVPTAPLATESDFTAVRVRAVGHAQPAVHIDFADRSSFVHLDLAWDRREHAGHWRAFLAAEARRGIVWVRRPPEAHTLALTMRSENSTAVVVRLDGQHLDTARLDARLQTVTLPLAGLPAPMGIERVSIEPQPCAGPFPIGSTGVSSPVPIAVTSRGFYAAPAASIRVAGVELSPNVRSYNLVALDPAGRLIDRAGFDLIPDAEGSTAQALATFVARLPLGAIVAVAVKDDGSLNFRPEVRAALGTLGIAAPPAESFRHAFAAIGVKGSAPGTALEHGDALQAYARLSTLELEGLSFE